MKRMLIVITITTLLITACNDNKTADARSNSDGTSGVKSSAEDREERNKETAMASARAFSEGNSDEGLKNVAVDAVEYGDGSMAAVKGIDSIKIFAKMFLASFPDYKGENLAALADGDKVAIIGDWSGTFKKDMMGMKATNKPFKVKDVDIYTFNSEGKITEHRSIQSMHTILIQAGASMSKK